MLKDARERTAIVFMRVASLYFVKHSLRHLRLGASGDKVLFCWRGGNAAERSRGKKPCGRFAPVAL